MSTPRQVCQEEGLLSLLLASDSNVPRGKATGEANGETPCPCLALCMPSVITIVRDSDYYPPMAARRVEERQAITSPSKLRPAPVWSTWKLWTNGGTERDESGRDGVTGERLLH